MRRRERDDDPVPARLRRFDPDQWPGADIWERHEAWHQARLAFEDAQPEVEWPEMLFELQAAREVPGPEPWPDAPWDEDAV